MILIADSGSSKTDWVIITDNQPTHRYKSNGINPFFQSAEDIYQLIKNTFKHAALADKINFVYFYGAGCIKQVNDEIVVNGIKKYFRNASIEVEDDMIGAARAIFGKNAGIACILGTGANSCKYDGTQIVEKIPALGFILGDEASGAYFGRKLINNYFKKSMPDELATKFNAKYNPDMGDVLNRIYKQEYPNRYLASFSYFLAENVKHPYIEKMILDGFDDFIQKNVAKYENYKQSQVGFVGSVAYHFSHLLKKSGTENGIEIAEIIEKPIDGLIKYHSLNK